VGFLMTKFEARIARSNWARALAEGRIVRFNSGASFRAFKTVRDAEVFVAACDDRQAAIVEPPVPAGERGVRT
jgi:hypothetical protein